MLRWREIARATILGALLAVSLSVSASAGVILLSGVETFLLDAGKILGGVFSVVMGLFIFAKAYNSLLLEPHFKAMEERQQRLIEGGLVLLEKSFDKMLQHHVEATDPHPIASDRMHEPLYEADQKILAAVEDVKKTQAKDGARLSRLIKSHNVAMGAQQQAVDAIACLGHRNPKASPFPRRADDPETADFTDLRGHAVRSPILVEEDDDEEPNG